MMNAVHASIYDPSDDVVNHKDIFLRRPSLVSAFSQANSLLARAWVWFPPSPLKADSLFSFFYYLQIGFHEKSGTITPPSKDAALELLARKIRQVRSECSRALPHSSPSSSPSSVLPPFLSPFLLCSSPSRIEEIEADLFPPLLTSSTLSRPDGSQAQQPKRHDDPAQRREPLVEGTLPADRGSYVFSLRPLQLSLTRLLSLLRSSLV